MAIVTGVSGALTEGTGVSPGTLTKLVKDFIVDFLKTAAAVLTAQQIMGVGDALAAPHAAGIAIASAAIGAAYRAVLRWAAS